MIRRMLSLAIIGLTVLADTGCQSSLKTSLEQMDAEPNRNAVGKLDSEQRDDRPWSIQEAPQSTPIRVHGGIGP
jgi:hypothetical protein